MTTTDDRTPAGNSGLAKVAVQCSADKFVGTESSVLRINFRGKNRHLRQAAKRYWQPWDIWAELKGLGFFVVVLVLSNGGFCGFFGQKITQ